MNTVKLTKKQHEVDSMMVGLILAGAKTAKKPIKTSTPAMEDEKSMCAIGAGNRARKITRKPDILSTAFERQDGRDKHSKLLHQLIPLIRFTTINKVTENYACGINDGFENSLGTSRSFYDVVDTASLDYERGWVVGQLVRAETGNDK